MSETWFVSDLHFSHGNIIRFKHNGHPLRPFASIEEHDETIIDNINAVVHPKDRLYILGDVAMHRRGIPLVGRLNGRKKLIKGNHDIFKLKDYTPYFEDISSYRIYPKHNLIVSHIPVHPCQLEHRFERNWHGHLHANIVMRKNFFGFKVPDTRYVNLCLEHTNYAPANFTDLIKRG